VRWRKTSRSAWVTVAFGQQGLIVSNGVVHLLEPLVDGVETALQVAEQRVQLHDLVATLEIPQQRLDDQHIPHPDDILLGRLEGTRRELLAPTDQSGGLLGGQVGESDLPAHRGRQVTARGSAEDRALGQRVAGGFGGLFQNAFPVVQRQGHHSGRKTNALDGGLDGRFLDVPLVDLVVGVLAGLEVLDGPCVSSTHGRASPACARAIAS
jgi:hypothetical protein